MSVEKFLYSFLSFLSLFFNVDVDVDYEINEKTASVAEANKNIICAIISHRVKGRPVTVIKDGAFEDCESLKSVIIPNSVNEICDRTFDRCKSIE